MPRKFRLYAPASACHLWPLLGDPRCRKVVAVAESFADGEAEAEELSTTHAAARGKVKPCRGGARHAPM